MSPLRIELGINQTTYHSRSDFRLRGGGPKKRCGCYITTTERCSSAAVRKSFHRNVFLVLCLTLTLLAGIVGDCSFCDVSFCGRHRLPVRAIRFRSSSSVLTHFAPPQEDHKCPNLSTCRQDAFLRNKAKLESEQTVGRKIEGM